MVDKQRKALIDFAQTAKGLDDSSKLKLILFAAGAKPATFFALKIDPKNLDEKEHLERHLKDCRIPFLTGRPKSYEEITAIKGNAVKWKMMGTWYGYDLFRDNRHLDLFQEYLELMRNQKHEKSDIVGGKLYDYPSCCVKHYIKEHDLKFLRKNYTHFSYYQHLHAVEKQFPLLIHTPCSTKCKASKKMNAKYAAVLKKAAPKFWKAFSAVKNYSMDVVVDSESELLQDVLYKLASVKQVFPVKDGHEYSVITLKQIGGHYYMYSVLSKECLRRGAVLNAKAKVQFNYAEVKLGKPKKVINNLHHERKFVVLS
jgi:hypothetical protein